MCYELSENRFGISAINHIRINFQIPVLSWSTKKSLWAILPLFNIHRPSFIVIYISFISFLWEICVSRQVLVTTHLFLLNKAIGYKLFTRFTILLPLTHTFTRIHKYFILHIFKLSIVYSLVHSQLYIVINDSMQLFKYCVRVLFSYV